MGCGASAAPAKYESTDSSSSKAESSGSRKSKSKSQAEDRGKTSVVFEDGPEKGRRSSVNSVVHKNTRMQEMFTLGKPASFQRPTSHRELQRITEKKSNLLRACRTIRKHRMDGRTSEQEAKYLQHLDHPSILKLLEVYQDQMNFYHIFPWPEGGKLSDRLESVKEISEDIAARFTSQILKGLAHMHSQKICHRGICLDVLYLHEKGPLKDGMLKIGDFELLCPMKDRGQGLDENVYEWGDSPWRYMAPEMVAKAPIYFENADVWATGVCCFILLAGDPPFGASDLKDVDQYRQELVYYGDWLQENRKTGSLAPGLVQLADATDKAKNFVKALLEPELGSRCSANDAAALPWLKSPGKGSKAISPKVLKGMRNYSNMNEFQKKIVQVVSTRMPDDQLKELQKMFVRLDKNNDGVISMQELADALHARPKKGDASKSQMEKDNDLIKQVEDLMVGVDTDASSGISYTEFIAACLDERHLAQEDIGWAAFRYFDTDGSGTITREELVIALKEMDFHDAFPAQAISLLFKEADSDGSKGIEFQEFMSMMQPGKDWSHLRSTNPSLSHQQGTKSQGAKSQAARCALCQQKRQVQDWNQDGQLICAACWMQG